MLDLIHSVDLFDHLAGIKSNKLGATKASQEEECIVAVTMRAPSAVFIGYIHNDVFEDHRRITWQSHRNSAQVTEGAPAISFDLDGAVCQD